MVFDPLAVTKPLTPSVVLSDVSPPEVKLSEVHCMQENMHAEAGGEGDRGMIAVGYIVMNRMSSGRYPKTACGVIHQGAVAKNGRPIHGSCQFNWTCDGKHRTAPKPEILAHERALALAVLEKQVTNPIGNSLYFHQVTVKVKLIDKITAAYQRIGHQVFYADVRQTRKRGRFE
jgi:spore germination cell wall hydrolase CwlJ-like protein